MSSSRFPGKVLADLAGRPMIAFMVDRVRQAAMVDEVVVATSDHASDDALAQTAADEGVRVVRGSLEDVLGRFALAAQQTDAEIVMRLTGDCPLIDPAVLDAAVSLRREANVDYVSNTNPPTYPDGMDCEVFTAGALNRASTEATEPPDREHVTLWMRRPDSGLTQRNLVLPFDASDLRLTVDYPDDLDAVRQVVAHASDCNADLFDILRIVTAHPQITANNRHDRNEALGE